LRVQLGLVHLDDVDEDIAAGALAELDFELLDLRALAADDDARPACGSESAAVARPLDLHELTPAPSASRAAQP